MGWNFRKKKNIPGGLWLKCPACGTLLQKKKLDENLGVCTECPYHFKVTAPQRVEHLADAGSFAAFGQDIATTNPLDFEGYDGTLKRSREKSGLDEAALVGTATLDGLDLVLGVLDFHFVGGSMGIVVGTRFALAAERARELGVPLVLVATSGGARMHEGALSLMQMAKTSAAIARLSEAGQPFVSVLADPCTGGVIASFAALGDVILAEPGALIGFAGPRVIQTTIGTQLPDGFQRAEFLLDHGFIDRIVPRTRLKAEIATCLRFCGAGRPAPATAAAAPSAPRLA